MLGLLDCTRKRRCLTTDGKTQTSLALSASSGRRTMKL